MIAKCFKKMFPCCFKDAKKAGGGSDRNANVNQNQENKAAYKEMNNSPEDPKPARARKGG
jgi:hypothetical protein